MIRLISKISLAILLSIPVLAFAAEASKPSMWVSANGTMSAQTTTKGLTVGQVLQINSGLAGMNCANKVLKDSGNEKIGCVPYEWSAAMTWKISEAQHKTEEVIKRYYKLRNEGLAALPRDKDGKVPGDLDAKFALRDGEMLEADSGLVLEHFHRADLEPMKLPPAVLGALWPIIDP